MSNEQILDAMPTIDVIKALVRRQGVDSMITNKNIHVIMVRLNVLHNNKGPSAIYQRQVTFIVITLACLLWLSVMWVIYGAAWLIYAMIDL